MVFIKEIINLKQKMSLCNNLEEYKSMETH